MDRPFVLDCTLRDGGYYNQWDFDAELVRCYLDSIALAGVDYVELGLRNFPGSGFKGAFAFTTEEFLAELVLPQGPKYGVMVDAKTVVSNDNQVAENVRKLFLQKEESLISLVRVATHFKEIDHALEACIELKALGYDVGLNLMQSVGKDKELLSDCARRVADSGSVDVLYYADSLGNMTLEENERIFKAIRVGWNGDVGLHAHDNTGAALVNTLAAFESGVAYLDATICGMGRGAGNVKTELLLHELSALGVENYNEKALYQVVLKFFEPMKSAYGWGSNLLYYLGAKYNIHPTYIQQLYSDPRFESQGRAHALSYLSKINASSYDGQNLDHALSFNRDTESQSEGATVVSAEQHSSEGRFFSKEILLVGAGESTSKYNKAIVQYILKYRPVVISVNINKFLPEQYVDYFIVSLNAKSFTDKETYSKYNEKLIAPASRISSLQIHPKINFEMKLDDFWEVNTFGCVIPNELTVSYALSFLKVARPMVVNMVGFDGYQKGDVRNRQMQNVFDRFKDGLNLCCLTPTEYNIPCGSVYAI